MLTFIRLAQFLESALNLALFVGFTQFVRVAKFLSPTCIYIPAYKIHMSSASRDLLMEFKGYAIRKRGEIEVKVNLTIFNMKTCP